MSARPQESARKSAIVRVEVRPPSSSTWIALAPALAIAALGAVLSGCSDAATFDPEHASSTAEAIYGGTVDNDSSQNAAVVSIRIGDGSPFELCSGSLIAPNVVLTARHCVSVNLTQAVACNENAASGNGPQVGAD